MRDVTLVMGLPGSGKSTWAKEHLGDGVVWDLDHIMAALLYRDDSHQPVRDDIRSAANSMLESFISEFENADYPVIVIRTAPRAEELRLINPTKIVYMTTLYDIRNRENYHDLTAAEMTTMAKRYLDTISWARRNNIELLEVQHGL